MLAIHLEENVVSYFGPSCAVEPPSACYTAAAAAVGHYGIRRSRWQHSSFGPWLLRGASVKRAFESLEIRLVSYSVGGGTSAFGVYPHHLKMELVRNDKVIPWNTRGRVEYRNQRFVFEDFLVKRNARHKANNTLKYIESVWNEVTALAL